MYAIKAIQGINGWFVQVYVGKCTTQTLGPYDTENEADACMDGMKAFIAPANVVWE